MDWSFMEAVQQKHTEAQDLIGKVREFSLPPIRSQKAEETFHDPAFQFALVRAIGHSATPEQMEYLAQNEELFRGFMWATYFVLFCGYMKGYEKAFEPEHAAFAECLKRKCDVEYWYALAKQAWVVRHGNKSRTFPEIWSIEPDRISAEVKEWLQSLHEES